MTTLNKIIFCWLVGLILWPVAGVRSQSLEDSMLHERENMVATQVEKRGVKDQRVLDALLTVPRHEFVPSEYRGSAYGDHPLPIGYGQTISQPYIVGLMTELAEIDTTDIILEIGTGSGYQAAVLSQLAGQVYSIEIIDTLAGKATATLERLGYNNVTVRSGDGFRGWPEHAPFDVILVTCAPAEVPRPLIEQLADGGRLVIPVGEQSQELKLYVKSDSSLTEKSVIPVRFVPMTGEAEDH